MAYSSILGADVAPAQSPGRDADLLGPSDRSDSGSDSIGTTEDRADSDSTGTGERGAVAGADAVEGADILPDRVVGLDGEREDPAELDLTDLDQDADDGAPDAQGDER